MLKAVIAILVIAIPLLIWCVCLNKRDEVFEQSSENVVQERDKDGKPVVTMTTKMGEILKMDDYMGDFLLSNGLHCVTCPSAADETLAAACEVHHLDAEKMLSKIQIYIEENA